MPATPNDDALKPGDYRRWSDRKAGASTSAQLNESIDKIIAEFEARRATARRALGPVPTDPNAMDADPYPDGQAGDAQLVRYGQTSPEDDMQVALTTRHSPQAGALDASSDDQLLLRRQLVNLMVQATHDAREVARQDAEEEFDSLLKRLGREVGNDWVKRVQEVGDEQIRLWLEKVLSSGNAMGDLWLQTIQKDGGLARDQWLQEIYRRGMQAGDAWVRDMHRAGLSGGQAWMRDMHRAGLKLGEAWVEQIHRDGLHKGEEWALDIQKAGLQKQEDWALKIQRIGEKEGESWALAFGNAARATAAAKIQEIEQAGDNVIDQLSKQLSDWHASPRAAKPLPIQDLADADRPTLTLEAPPAAAMRPNQKRSTSMSPSSEETQKRIADLEAQIKIAELEAKLAAMRSGKASASTADQGLTSGAGVATSASQGPAKDFIRDKDTPLRVPEGREAEALEIPGVAYRDSSYGGQYLCMEAGNSLLPAKAFWNERTNTEYKALLGQPTFTREAWTELDVKPDESAKWTAVKQFYGVIEVDNELGHKLLVPRDVDLLPTMAHWPENVKEKYINKDEPKNIVTQWTKLYVPTGDASAQKRAEAVPGVRTFNDGGQKVLGVPPEGDATPAKKAGFIFSGSEWTTLKVPKGDWDEAKALTDVREYTRRGEKVLAVRPQGNALFARKFWSEETQREYEARDEPKFRRKVFTELTLRPGSKEFERVKVEHNLSKSKFRSGKLVVPPGKDLLPHKAHWPEGVTKEYESLQKANEQRARGRTERAKAVGR